MTSSKRWVLLPPLSSENLRSYRNLNPVMAQVLYNRGLGDYEAATHFLEGHDIQHPSLGRNGLKGIDEALGRIRHAIRKKEPIIVYGDFDADGVTSTVLLVQTLRALGAKVRPYIPHRVDEGYGLNTPALLQLAQEGVKLVITVDCGIRSVEEVKAGNAAGLDIIVTDHHSVGELLPPALAVINPKQADCSYPEDMLAGVGIAFKVAEALLLAEKRNSRTAPDITTEQLLDLVAIGTVADLAPLDSPENRTLVRKGLEQLNRAKRPGVYALLSVAGIEPGKVSATSIGFGLGPRINAAGRLESAMTAYQLLSTENIDEAMRLASELQELNTQRQELTQIAQEEASALAQADEQAEMPMIFAAAPHFQSGIVGLVAGRLAEQYYRPAIVIEQGEEESRGSCRSIPEFNITAALDECAHLLLRHGGHAQAAGFSILTENIPAFKARLMEIVREQLSLDQLQPSLTVDAEIQLKDANLELAKTLRGLEPIGHNNPIPVFMTSALKVQDARTVGRDDKHLKLRLSDGPRVIDGIAFRQGYHIHQLPTYIDVAYQLEINEWNGSVKPQLNVLDIRAAGS